MKKSIWFVTILFTLISYPSYADMSINGGIGGNSLITSWDETLINDYAATWGSIDSPDYTYSASNNNGGQIDTDSITDISTPNPQQSPSANSWSYAYGGVVMVNPFLDMSNAKVAAHSLEIITLSLTPNTNITDLLIPFSCMYSFEVLSEFSTQRSNQNNYYGQLSHSISLEIQNELGFYDKVEKNFFFDAIESADMPAGFYDIFIDDQYVDLNYNNNIPNVAATLTIKLETIGWVSNPIPEPATLFLLVLGGLALRRNRN